jgi:hypothetical protein
MFFHIQLYSLFTSIDWFNNNMIMNLLQINTFGFQNKLNFIKILIKLIFLAINLDICEQGYICIHIFCKFDEKCMMIPNQNLSSKNNWNWSHSIFSHSKLISTMSNLVIKKILCNYRVTKTNPCHWKATKTSFFCLKLVSTIGVTTPLWPSVRMKLTLPKFGTWSPPGLPNV